MIEFSEAALVTARRHVAGLARQSLWIMLIGTLLVAAGYAAAWLVGGGPPVESVWQYAAVASGWIAFVLFLALSFSDLPVHVANGGTRHDFLVGAHLAMPIVAALFAVFVAMGFLAEATLAVGFGADAPPVELHVIGSGFQTGAALIEFLAAISVHAACGLLVGATYYRLGGVWGTVLLPLSFSPVILFGSLMGPGGALRTGGSVAGELAGVVAAAVGCFALAALLSWLVVRDVPLRSRPVG